MSDPASAIPADNRAIPYDGRAGEDDADMDDFESSWGGDSMFDILARRVNNVATTHDSIFGVKAYRGDVGLEIGLGRNDHNALSGNILEALT